MAAADTPSASHAERRYLSRRGVGWFGTVGVLLALAVVVIGGLQWRQLSLLSQAVVDDGGAWVSLAYRTEAAYLRVYESWPRETTGAALPGAKDADLARRWQTFVERVRALREQVGPGPDQQRVPPLPEVGAALSRSEYLIAQLGLRLEPATPRLLALRTEIDTLGESMQAMSRRAGEFVEAQSQQRREAVAQHNRIGMALTLVLTLLTLAFAYIALRQLSRLEQRREVLEELTTSLNESRREAETASAAKSAFLANMSHELRTPFQGLLGMLSLLRETGLSARQMDYLRTATESADHLLRILNDVLDMSQLESGRLTLSPVDVDLRLLLRDVEALMRPQALRKNLALHIDADPAVPERVELDPTRVKQVLFNLLANAIKFSERGAVVLDVRVAAGADQKQLVFIVTDTGIGMDATTLAGLFKRFSQGDNSRSRRFGGTGLGLEISRDLARLMGGDIEVRSRLGEGSAFTFKMPLHESVPALLGAHQRAEPVLGQGGMLHVLVAEDHPVNRQYLAAVLDSLGHQAHFAADGEEAVMAARQRRFDLVLMDLHMPKLDGIGATRAIRALPDPALASMPIVALTADAFPETRQRCMLAGMNDFLTKPISAQALATTLRRLFGGSAGISPIGEMHDTVPLTSARASRGESGHSTLSPLLSQSTAMLDQATINTALQSMSRERLAAMMREFLGEAPVTLERLRAAVRDGQPLDLRVNAHAARGAALNLGFAALAATAEALREGASHLPAHEIALLVKRFEDQIKQTHEALARLGLVVEGVAGD
jgi:two-component system, sensor histidine kinase